MTLMTGFDLETTGKDPETARIVEYGFAHVGGGQPSEFVEERVNPGVPIPAEAAQVHGITDEMVAAAMSAEAAVTRIVRTIAGVLAEGRLLVGHNIVYDLTVLDRECRRHLGEGLESLLGVPVRPVVDTLVLSKHLDPYRKRVSDKQGAHQLRTCVEKMVTPRWPSVVWDEGEAHGALYDCRMALYVAAAVLALPKLSNLGLGELHDAQVGWKAAQAAGFQTYLRNPAKAGDSYDPGAVVDGRWPVVPAEPRQEALLGRG
ncbi:exonuclease domain-containing protein [Nocardiopsis sp. FR26]|uniref:exonuclease domain-containing protein n=1 Tax=Nocardiopsis sp. FR26 TaxID=2605987 RepID=UPI001357B804|nr:exonuclease domain-containing protein [Nocardiopsis sp. FR26]